MNLLPSDGLVPVKGLEAPMVTGSFPSWVDDGGTGGTTVAHDASQAGGYWELDPGAERRGDEARLRTSFGLRPDAYDVVEFASRVSVTTTDVADLAFRVGFDGPDGYGLWYSYLHPDDDLNDRLSVHGDGVIAGYDARRINDERPHELAIRWFPTADRVELYTDAVLGATGEAVGLPAAKVYRPTWSATDRGGEPAVVRVHRAAIRYYEQPNPTASPVR